MVLTPHRVFAKTDGVVSVLLDHTRTRGPSVARMRDFCQSIIRCSVYFVIIDLSLGEHLKF